MVASSVKAAILGLFAYWFHIIGGAQGSVPFNCSGIGARQGSMIKCRVNPTLAGQRVTFCAPKNTGGLISSAQTNSTALRFISSLTSM